MVTGGYGSEDCIYGGPVFSKHSVDSYLVLNADRAYDNFSSSNIYGTKFVYYSEECMDSSFLFDCKGCTNCFGCVNLRNKQYCIFNQQYSKAEYREQMKYWDTGSFVRLQEAREKFMALKMQTPHRYAIVTNGIDVTGNDIQNSKNCTYCFVAKNGVENCKYISGGGLLLKDSHDVTSGGDKSQVLYNCAGTVSSDHMICVNGANTAHDVAYSEQAINCSDMFGCAFLKHKQFCILNKQYTEQEYRSLREKIVQQMYDMPYRDRKDRSYTYGDYFPIEMSPFAYNESWAFDQYALTKEKTQAAGYNWRDRVSSHHVPDIRSGELVDHIRDVDASITTRVIECAHRESCNEICTGAFKVIPEELQFYQQNNVALPRLCPNCRHFQRLSFQNPLKLWHRKCANCTNEFETTYAPDRKEIIYCQECYNREFL